MDGLMKLMVLLLVVIPMMVLLTLPLYFVLSLLVLLILSWMTRGNRSRTESPESISADTCPPPDAHSGTISTQDGTISTQGGTLKILSDRLSHWFSWDTLSDELNEPATFNSLSDEVVEVALPNEQARDLMDMVAITIKGLEEVQRDVARLLHIAYFAYRKKPDSAAKIHSVARHALVQRQEAAVLVRDFALKAHYIGNILKDYILKGVDTQDTSLVIQGLHMAVQIAENMTKDTATTETSCRNLLTEVQLHLDDIQKKESTRNKRGWGWMFEQHSTSEKITRSFQSDVLRTTTGVLAPFGLGNYIASIKCLKDVGLSVFRKQKRVKKTSSHTEKRTSQESDTRTQKLEASHKNLGLPYETDATEIGDNRDSMVDSLFCNINQNSFTGSDSTVRVTRLADLGMKLYCGDQLATKYRQHRQEEETRLTWLSKMHDLSVRAASACDTSALVSAVACIETVDAMLNSLKDFWDILARCITELISDTTAGKVYMKAIEKDEVKQKFVMANETSRQEWLEFERTCNWYHTVCESNTELYGFIGKDGKSSKAHQGLVEEIERDIVKKKEEMRVCGKEQEV